MDKTQRRIWVSIAAVLILSGCASVPTGSLCTAGPIVLDEGATERLTRSEKEQIVTLNNAGEQICEWERP